MSMKPEEKKLREELIGAEDTATFQRNYLVEAGAGAGKTYTMVRRIANHLVSGACEPENLVAITFTKKATEEMRGRLDSRLAELLDYAKNGERDESGTKLSVDEKDRRVRRLTHLVRNAGRMQISTIHSFCQTMLSIMPFASPLGPSAEFGEDEGANARAFFARYRKNNPNAFSLVQSRFGVSNDALVSFFAARCANKGAAVVAKPITDPEVTAWENTCKAEAKKLHRKLRTLLGNTLVHDDMTHIDAALANVLRMDKNSFENDDDAVFTLIRLINQNASAFPLRAFDDTAKTIREVAAVSPENLSAEGESFVNAHALTGAITALDKCWKSTAKTVKKDEPAVGLLRTDSKLLLYAWLIHEMLPVLEAYRTEKRERRQAFSDDQLMLARDMLRDSAPARAYFHGRYKAVYVDEFQDTDPIQTELLFYLTADETSFDPNDWRNCRPVPGSLFLVGDPKQSIYGFRGADISIYREVRGLFDGTANAAQGKPIGRCVALTCSFRASEAVCRYNNLVFGKLFQAGDADRQAQFAEMDVNISGGADAGVFFYGCRPEGNALEDGECSEADARMLSAFIEKMVHSSNAAGKPYRYKDFMLLTPTTSTVPFYMDALAEAGIPANITAKHTYGEFLPLQRLQMYLEWLLGRNAELTLLRLLKDGYRVKLSTVHALLQRGGLRTISETLMLNDSRVPFYSQLAAEIWQERDAETDPDKRGKLDDLLALCGALEELNVVQRMAHEAPAMSTIEYILHSCRGIWDDGTSLEHRRQCGWVLQFLALLRGYEQHSFPALAAFAIDSMRSEVSQELTLGAEEDCVRVMNLHQAKGLEARVVILTYSTKGLAAPTAMLERSGGETKEYAALTHQRYPGAAYSTIAYPPEWEGAAAPKNGQKKASFKAKDVAKRRNEAERVRLLYVAATRAAELLLINVEGEDRSFWAPAVSTTAAEDANAAGAGQTLLCRYPDAFGCLLPGKVPQTASAGNAPIPPSSAAANRTAVSAIPAVNGFALERSIAERAGKLAQTRYFAITPSGLDHGAYAPTRADRAADAEDGTPAALTVLQDRTEEVGATPCGTHWGTIVHSVMEQAVRRGDHSPSALAQYAREAASSVLLNGALSEREWDMVLGGKEIVDVYERAAFVAEKAAEAAAFFSDDNSPLRVLTDGAECYPELPFTLCETDSDSALFRHLDQHFSRETLAGKKLDLQGVIDLAIWRCGEWTVVDYKTDRVRKGESREDFRARLCSEYTAQIASYAQVLERLRGKVARAVLCSIALGGELIELPLDTAVTAVDRSAETKRIPRANGGMHTATLAELIQGRSFSPALQTAQGAHDFSLLRHGVPVMLTDNGGARADTFKACTRFVDAVVNEINSRCPNTPCFVDPSNAGTVVLLRRLLRAMRRVLPPEEWDALAFRWTK